MDNSYFHEYSADWVSIFNDEKCSLLEVLKGYYVNVHHVGSTAIPNMPGKGIIDILVTLESFEHLNEVAEKLLTLGYISRPVPSRPESPFFTKPSTRPRTHNLHLALSRSHRERSMLTFRDYLKRFPKEAKKYENEKRAIVALNKNDRKFYSEKKSRIATEIEERAVRWYLNEQG